MNGPPNELKDPAFTMRILLFSLFLGAYSFTLGQNGIRFTMAHFEMPLGNVKPNILLGYDKEFRERFSIGIDLIKSFEYAQRVVRFNGLQDQWGVQYRATYHLGDAGYIGSTIGFRSVTSTRFPANQVPSTGRSDDIRSARAIIPAGIRSGFRTALKGVYADIYVGLGYNFGSDGPPLNDSRRDNVLKAPWINFGYAMGIGWVRS